ncbi:MAG: peptidyl-prolyl cis-trans isomerase [Candidatus Sulfotelmatobacter sp.]
MRHKLSACILLMTALVAAAQVASHAPTGVAAPSAAPPVSPWQITDKPVARVNGAVLTDRDLLREMYAIFPYARQHNGFPRAQEASIRQGALQMIIFEELVYQEGERREMTISAARLNNAEAQFRKQFNSPDEYDQYMQAEMHGSRQVLRKQIERSLLIEQLLKIEVEDKSAVSLAELKAYYDRNPARFEQPESFNIQSITILPPQKPSPEAITQNRKRAEDALRQARATRSFEEFGLLAEKISEDDFRVNMGDHRAVGRDKLPPPVVEAALAMQAGQVSGVVQIGNAFTIFRLNAHNPARKQPFAEAKAALRTELEKGRYERLRSNFAKRLRANAKIEIV